MCDLVSVSDPSAPDLSAIPLALLSLAEPDETALIEALKTRISRLMIEEISANDYGEDASLNFDAIQEQLGPAPVLGRLDWCPREVLELERWNEPEEGNTEADQVRAHLKRLWLVRFCSETLAICLLIRFDSPQTTSIWRLQPPR